MAYGDERMMLIIVTQEIISHGCIMMIEEIEHLDNDHALNDGMYPVFENGINYSNIGLQNITQSDEM
jgi:hypothetical protein